MATSTIKKSGGDYSSITAWEAAANVSGQIWEGVISDNENYDEHVVIDGNATGATNYLKLTVASANRHSGIAGTGHARMIVTGSGHGIDIRDEYTVIEYLEIKRSTGASSSDECIRISSGGSNTLISRCIIWTDQTTADCDGIYAGNWAVTVYVDHCIIYGFARAGIHAQNHSGGNTQTWYVDYCFINKCGSASEGESGGLKARAVSGNTVNINVYNTASLNTVDGGSGSGEDFEDEGSGGHDGTVNWTGTHNACSDTSLTARGLTTGAQESLTLSDTTQSTGSFFVVKETAGGSEDYRLLDDAGGNKAYGNGTDRSSSEPDSRQDFSIDIEGNARLTSSPSPDIGADEYIASGGFVDLAAAFGGVGAIAGPLHADKELTGSLAGTGSVTAPLHADKGLGSTIAGVGSVSGPLHADKSLSATIAGVGSIVGTLVTSAFVNLAASIAAVSTITGRLRPLKSLTSTIAASGVIAAGLKATKELASTITGTGSVTGRMRPLRSFVATIAGTATITATLVIVVSSAVKSIALTGVRTSSIALRGIRKRIIDLIGE